MVDWGKTKRHSDLRNNLRQNLTDRIIEDRFMEKIQGKEEFYRKPYDIASTIMRLLEKELNTFQMKPERRWKK